MSTSGAAARVLSLGGADVLDYTIRWTGRRRTVGLIVEPDGRVTVLAPASTSTQRIERILRRHITWIRRQRREVEALPPPPTPREWVNGETHRYLGRQYRLKIVRGDESTVRLRGPYFIVHVPGGDDRRRVQHLMESWYREHASALLSERIRRVLAQTTWLDIDFPPIRIRQLRTQWGSSSPLGQVTFNLDLIKLPLSCVDYVVAHELVHLMIPNHSPAYWRMLERVMPDWRRWRRRLATIEL